MLTYTSHLGKNAIPVCLLIFWNRFQKTKSLALGIDGKLNNSSRNAKKRLSDVRVRLCEAEEQSIYFYFFGSQIDTRIDLFFDFSFQSK